MAGGSGVPPPENLLGAHYGKSFSLREVLRQKADPAPDQSALLGVPGINKIYIGLECGHDACMPRKLLAGVKRNHMAATLQEFSVQDQYDLVTNFDVLEHIADDAGFLRDLHRVLRDNGHVLVTVPAYQFLWSDLDRLLGHVRRYNKRDLVRCFEEAGFTVSVASYFNSFLAVPFIAVRWTQTRTRRASTLKDYAMELHPWLNNLFLFLMTLEAAIVPRIAMPFGTSIILLAKKQRQ